jgi:hypothetical protein
VRATCRRAKRSRNRGRSHSTSCRRTRRRCCTRPNRSCRRRSQTCPRPVLSFTVWVPRRPRTPLFEVAGDSCSQTPITQRPGPVWVHRSGIGAALAANTDPIDAVEVKAGQRTQQRLQRHEPRPAPHAIHRHTSSTRQTRSTFPATHSATAMGMCPPGEASSWLSRRASLDRSAIGPGGGPHRRRMHPTVSQQFPHPVRALGQDLTCVLRRERHCREHPAQEIGRDAGMEHVRHTVQEYHSRTARPLQERLENRFRCMVTPNPGPLVRGSPSFCYFGEHIALSRLAIVIVIVIAVITPRRKPVTPSRRIPRNLCPLDLRGAQDISLLDRVRDTHRARQHGLSPAGMTADPKLTPTERSATQGCSFAAAECTAYLSVVWRAVHVDGHGDELPRATGALPRGPSWGIPWVPVTVHSDSGTSLVPSRFNSTLYPSPLS